MAKTKIEDLTGRRFGRLTVLERVEDYRCETWYPWLEKPIVNKTAQWLCRCDCGNEKVVIGANLRAGRTKSCGCLQRERRKRRGTAQEKAQIEQEG